MVNYGKCLVFMAIVANVALLKHQSNIYCMFIIEPVLISVLCHQKLIEHIIFKFIMPLHNREVMKSMKSSQIFFFFFFFVYCEIGAIDKNNFIPYYEICILL